MAIIKNLTIDQYSNWEKTFTLYKQNREPFDLTNYTAKADIKKHANTQKLASFECTVLSPKENGNILLSLNYDSLVDIKEGEYEYDILLTSTIDNNVKIRAVEGSIVINGNVTT